MSRISPDFSCLAPASAATSRAAKASSKKKNTKPELGLRRALFARGLRYRVDARELPGKPDIVFRRARVAIFVDGDFWHGRDLETRVAKLKGGHNASYWVAKIRGNFERDRRHDRTLQTSGWAVLRFWESEISRDVDAIVGRVVKALESRH